jgi:hypothetical protein
MDDGQFCKLCGSSMAWEDCWYCGGAGEFDLYDEDPLYYDEDDTERCEECKGRGGYYVCLNVKNHEARTGGEPRQDVREGAETC